MRVNMAIMFECVGKNGNYVGKCGLVRYLCGRMYVRIAINRENVGKYGKFMGKCG
jgi:hypothetical protein